MVIMPDLRTTEGIEYKGLLSNEEEDDGSSGSSSSRPGRWEFLSHLLRHWPILVVSLNLVLLVCSLVILGYSFRQVCGLSMFNGTDMESNRLLREMSAYSPIFDKLDIPFRLTTTNGSFWPQNPPSLFQLPPSPEVDAAWNRIADTHAIVLSRKEVEKMGKDPAELYTFPESYGYGKEAYIGLPDVFHQLHCLNDLRRVAHSWYYYPDEDSRNSSASERTHGHGHAKNSAAFPHEVHLEHCTYILLQSIMCHADVGVVTFNKVEGTPGPFADFNIDHKCRDFQSVLEWKERNQVNATEEEWLEVLATPEGIKELPAEGRSMPFPK